MKKKSLLMLLPGLAMIMAGCGKEPQKPADNNNNQQQQEDAEVSPTAMKLKETSKDMKVGDEWELEIEWTPSNTTKDGAIYESSDPTVARISPDGLVTALKPGWSDITVKSTANTELSYNAKVLVLPNDLTHAGTQADPFTAAEAASIAELIKDKKDSASKYFVEGIVKNVVSLDASKGATVDLDAGNGKVFEIYQLKGPEGAVYEGVDIVPCDKVVVNAEIKKYGTTLETGDGEIVSVQKITTEYVKAQATMSLKIEATGQISPIYRGTPESITYASDAEAVATVSTEGLVTAVAVGKANITVTANYAGGGTATWTLQVIVLPETVHAGTEADPFDLADACSYADSLPAGGKTDEAYYIKGIVSRNVTKTGDLSSYGQMTFWFESGELAFECYQVYAGPELVEGEGMQRFTSMNQIETGDEVTVYAPFTKYVSAKTGEVTLETVQRVGYTTQISKLKATEIKSVKSKPEQVEIGADVNSLLEKFTIVVGFNNGQPDAEKNPTSIELDTSVANENATAVLHYGELTINCSVKVAAIPPVMQENGVYYLSSKVEGTPKYLWEGLQSNSNASSQDNQYDATEIVAVPVAGQKDVYKLAKAGTDPKQYLYISDYSSSKAVKFGFIEAAAAQTWVATRNNDGSFGLYTTYDKEGTPTNRYLGMYSDGSIRHYAGQSESGVNYSFSVVEATLPTELKVEDAPTVAYVGESLNLTGKVKATFGGTDQVVSTYKVSPENFEEATAEKEITVSFKNLTAKFTVEVKTRTLESITINGDMTKKTYNELGDEWDFSGLTITGSYEGGSTDSNFDVSLVEFTADKTPAEVFAANNGTLVVTAKVKADETKSATITITGLTIVESPKNVDVLNAKNVPMPASSYAYKEATDASGIVYNIRLTKNANYLQIQKSTLGVYTKNSNRVLKSIEIEYDSSTSDSNVIQVYANKAGYNEGDTFATTNPDYINKITPKSESKVISFEESSGLRNFALYLTSGANANIKTLTVTYYETVLTNVVDSLTLDKSEETLHVGESLQLNATLKGLGTYEGVSWESSNSEIATVSNAGLVEAVAVGGPVTITAKSSVDETKTATCIVTVEAARSFTELTTTGGFKTAYSKSDSEFAIDDLVVTANYSDGSSEVVTDYTVNWSEAFNNTVGSHSSTPTIQWDGHEQELNAVTYTVAEASASIDSTLSFPTGTTPDGWSSSYAAHELSNDDFVVKFAAAGFNKTTGWDNNMVVSKTGEITVTTKNNAKITGFSLVCKQWGSKAKTLSYKYTLNGSDWLEGSTSTNFTLTATGLANATSIKFSSTPTGDQIGYVSLTLTIVK